MIEVTLVIEENKENKGKQIRVNTSDEVTPKDLENCIIALSHSIVETFCRGTEPFIPLIEILDNRFHVTPGILYEVLNK